MKYIVLLGDGMAGQPVDSLGGKTTLAYAKTPNMDYMARTGELGLAKTVPDGLPPGSDVANLAVLGYDPKKYYTGRAPLEAASIGVPLGPDDVAYRCNLVTLNSPGELYDNGTLMEDFSAGHITTEEARRLVNDIEARLGSSDVKFYPGVSYRHLMVWKGGKDKIECTPPHDITGKAIASYLPKGDGAEFVMELMRRSVGVLAPLYEPKKCRANSIWLWGQGKRPALPSFKDTYGLSGAVISAVDLLKGIAVILGLEVIDVPGATGYIDTNYKGKAQAALRAIEDKDFVYVHVEAPDEAGHGGNLEHKIKAIEDFDSLVVGTVLSAVRSRDDVRVLVMPDHPTPIAVKSHTSDPVPFIIWGPGSVREENNKAAYDEESAKKAGLFIKEGYTLMGRLLH